MPFTLTMPKLSPTMEAGTITKWHKAPGEFVESGELLLEVTTDKATVEYQALDEGWLRLLIAKEGDDAFVNQAIAIFTEEEKESIEAYKPEGTASPVVDAAHREIAIEHALDSLDRSSLKTPQLKTPQSSVTPGLMQQAAFVPELPLENYTFPRVGDPTGRVMASPLAKRLAKEKGLDLSTVKGTGPDGRVMSRDLGKAQVNGALTFGRCENPKYQPGTYFETQLTPMRKAISRRLQEAKTFIPHFYTKHTIHMDKLDATREELKELGVKVSFNDFVVRACALALREHPVINSGFNTVNNTVVTYQTVDVSIAVSVDGGFITPIVRHADFKNLAQISLEIRELAKRARDGNLELHEYKGGSFTVSNLGMFGITEFSAIINPPQGAILAVGGINEVPIVKDAKIVPGKVMQVTLSADHRVIDGAAAAEFLRTLKRFLEAPSSLLL